MMRLLVLAAVAAVGSTGGRHVAAMSTSKISVHSGGMQPVTTQFLHQAQPRLIKILDSFGDTGARMKAIVPGIVTVGRIYHDAQPEDSGGSTTVDQARLNRRTGRFAAMPCSSCGCTYNSRCCLIAT